MLGLRRAGSGERATRFRDLRGPLIAGYLWLIFAWLLFEPDVDYRPPEGVGAAAYDLAHRVGPIALAIAASVAAYLVGAVSHEFSRWIAAAWSGWDRLPLWARGGVRPSTAQQVDVVLAHGRVILAGINVSDELRKSRETELEKRAEEAKSEAEEELDLPATLLIGEKPGLFAEVDRIRAEADLRLAVAPPLLANAVLLAIEGSRWWLLAIPPILVLFLQGVRRDFEWRQLTADAIRLGRIASSSIGRFAAWVEGIPKALEKAEVRHEAALEAERYMPGTDDSDGIESEEGFPDHDLEPSAPPGSQPHEGAGERHPD
jgi:hypothetical protein